MRAIDYFIFNNFTVVTRKVFLISLLKHSICEFFPDLKDHLFEFVVGEVSQKNYLLQLKGVVNLANSA
jgi:hypothetical protein